MSPDALEVLKQRPAIGWLRERDIDLLLCAELSVDGSLRRHFADLWHGNAVSFEGAWVSHHDVDGESDLVVAFDGPNGKLILLIENKVDAEFQPDQQDRYRMRAKRWEASGRDCEVRTVLLAPEDYLKQPGSEQFDRQISYERLVEALRGTKDPRSQFVGKALQDGIDHYREGYAPIPDDMVSNWWTTIYEIAAAEQPRLNLKKPGPKPKGAGFIRCPDALGFSSSDRERVELILKRRRIGECHVDLQFSHVSPSDLRDAVSTVLERDMRVVPTGKSANIRLAAPPVDFARSPHDQLENIREWLRHAERLRRFFEVHRPLELIDERRVGQS